MASNRPTATPQGKERLRLSEHGDFFPYRPIAILQGAHTAVVPDHSRDVLLGSHFHRPGQQAARRQNLAEDLHITRSDRAACDREVPVHANIVQQPHFAGQGRMDMVSADEIRQSEIPASQGAGLARQTQRRNPLRRPSPAAIMPDGRSVWASVAILPSVVDPIEGAVP